MKNPTIVNDQSALKIFGITPRNLTEAISRALVNEDHDLATTRWSDSLSSSRGVIAWGGIRFGSRIIDSRSVTVAVTPLHAFAPISRIGGQQGWYFANFLWTIRGLIDLMCGGIGLRRARRDPKQVRVGDVLDWWRVEEFKPNRLLRLSAEMKVPGRAWLEFTVEPDREGSVIRQTAIFDPIGFFGLAYWYGIYPLHALVFRGMLRNIAAAARLEPSRAGDLSGVSSPK